MNNIYLNNEVDAALVSILRAPNHTVASKPVRIWRALVKCASTIAFILAGACGTEPTPWTKEVKMTALVARTTLLWAARAPVAANLAKSLPAYEVYFVATPADLGCGSKCAAESWKDDKGVWQVYVAMVDWQGQAPTTDVLRTPLFHELLHILSAGDHDATHKATGVWGPAGIEGRIYADLTMK